MSDIAKGIRECLDKINELRGQNATKDAEIARLNARVAELEKAVTQCRSLTKFLKPQADRIAELETALKAAAEDIGNWGAYASQYFQEKWDLSGEVKRYTAISEGKLPYRARYSMEEPKDEC